MGFERRTYVTLSGWSAKQTIPLSVLARNQTKGLGSRSPTRPEVEKERQIREKPEQWARERQLGQLAKWTEREESAKGDAEGQSTTDSSLRDIEFNCNEEDRQDEFAVLSRQRSEVRKTVKDELAFLVAWRSFAQIHASVSLQMYWKCSVPEPPFLQFELTQAHIVRLFFFSHSLGCISCGHKEMWDTSVDL